MPVMNCRLNTLRASRDGSPEKILLMVFTSRLLNAYAREFRPRSESKERSFQVMRPVESLPVDVVNSHVHLSGVSPFRNSQRTSFPMDKTSKLKG